MVAANFGIVQFAQAYDLNEKTLLWASPMVARQNCVYGFSSKEAFICPAPSFALAIDGVDDNGHPYRRVQITHCKGFRREFFFNRLELIRFIFRQFHQLPGRKPR